MVSALYAVLGALLLMKFSFNVVRLRMQYRVAYGDGGFLIAKRHPYSWQRGGIYSCRAGAAAVYGNERRRNVDGAYLRHHFNRRSADALLRFSPPPVPLAAGGDERDLVRIVADGAGKPVVYALGVGFLLY